MDERIRELAHRLVNYSCRVSRGDRVVDSLYRK